nr:LacI family DNA-binding transcriptional regulator [Streptomyces broussonetiae]
MTRRLAEAAKNVGAGEATVGRVLSGEPGVSRATRPAVPTALDVLGHERPTRPRADLRRLGLSGSANTLWPTRQFSEVGAHLTP